MKNPNKKLRLYFVLFFKALHVKKLPVEFDFKFLSFFQNLGFMKGALKHSFKIIFLFCFFLGFQQALANEEAIARNSQQNTNKEKDDQQKTTPQGTKSQSSNQSSPKPEPAQVKIENLDQLLQVIKEDQIQSRPSLRAREQRFLEERNKQKTLLMQAKRELRREEMTLKRLQTEFEKRDKELAQLEEKLTLTMGALGELFGVVKQNSAEVGASFSSSVISAEYPDRQKFTQKISAKKNLPDTEDLEKLWFLIQQEMTESGRVTRFETPVVSSKGKSESKPVIRVGSFNLISEGKYLTLDSETNKVLELSRQPKRRYLSLAKKIEKGITKDQSSTDSEIYKFGVDPSRGSLLSLLIQSPHLFERLAQGGVIGYLILILLLVGLALCMKKYRDLSQHELLLENSSPELSENNPLGKLTEAFNKFKTEKSETLELKLDEVLLKQVASLKKGLSTVKLLASTSPLLGLLGTVIGMIATFQSITLFGTGDPKLMAGGISQALVTTALGLIAAVPLIFLHSFLQAKANKLSQILQEKHLSLLSQKSQS